eukprot:CAMPEP_0204035320 /NCGR_PEP_ID=MMETSP0360-20130528/75673_1 /ASSEMBLY_ACC=CAM_ASM_000342 /TAXON_ID=268821 /ORGANISM="Scrippsiella Hangoei, Strain SHTV-5" /LENGTH=54 /DNA_ID=CAMNT_0050980297 /DNA_START=58 /DNA_END=219 /DNA_ORIENTATION=+
MSKLRCLQHCIARGSMGDKKKVSALASKSEEPLDGETHLVGWTAQNESVHVASE